LDGQTVYSLVAARACAKVVKTDFLKVALMGYNRVVDLAAVLELKYTRKT
jgi:hypothetical protein